MSKRVLIVRLSAIGDVVLSTPVARQLKRQHPDWHLTWLVQQPALPSIAHNPWLDAIEVMPYYGARPLGRIWRDLRGRFDITIDLQCLAKSAFVTWEVGSPLRVGRQNAREWAGLAYNRHTPVSHDYRYLSQHCLEQCLEFGVDIEDYVPELHPSPEDQAAAEALLAAHGLTAGGPPVALIAFSRGPGRRWPLERYAEVGDRLAEAYGARCLIPGMPSEVAEAEVLAGMMRHRPAVLAGQTSLGEAAAVLQRCALAIGPDTGLTHYSFAVGTPLVCLLGPTPLLNGPTSPTAVTLAAPCPRRPCRPHQRCRLQPDRPKDQPRPCMLEITVPQVLEAARGLLDAGRGGA